MRQPVDPAASRRLFLKFLASSPLLASTGLSLGLMDELLASGPAGAPDLERLMRHYARQDDVIASEADALSVFDFHAVAKKVLPPAHYGYLSTSVDDDSMLRVNREGFTKFQLRMRRLVDVSTIDMSTELLGTTWETPIFLCPVAGHMAYHREGEVAVARAARAKGHLQMLSNETSTGVEDVNAARGEPVWFQLYTSNEWEGTVAKVKRAEAAGCPALVFTVDLQGGRNTETDRRMRRLDDRQCDLCHDPDRPKPMYEGIARSLRGRPRDMTWDYITRLKALTPMKVLVKGIVTREDAELCVAYGADAIVVSNHGGRAESSGRSSIECLPEVAEAVRGRIPILIDSGFRRGTDMFKALALGASAVGIGRPYIWGLAGFGQAGVEAVLEILRRELAVIMRQAGTTSIARITQAHVLDNSR